MTNKKSTKRALLLSALSLLMCISLLVGSTFAWFTDSVTSGKNKIVAGNLDVELKYGKVENGQIAGWDTVQGKDDIFDPNALWEPGRVEVVYLEVSNLGSLALKYQLGVNISKEIEGVNVAGDTFKLSDYLVFKTVEMPDGLTTYTDREAAALAAGTAMGLKDYNGTTTPLEVNGKDYVALIVYMPETVGNEANYRENKQPSIELGINLYATQYTAESDSFGPDYDKGANHDKFLVTTGNDLQNAVNEAEPGDVIELENDIELTEALVIPAAPAAFARAAAPAPIVIDLNGKALNITVAYDGNNYNASSAVVNYGNVKLTGNGTIKATNNYTVRNNGAMIIDGVTIENGIMNFADLTVESGNISNSRSGKHTIYGNNATLTINGGTFYNGNPGNAAIFSYAGAVTINGGEFSIADGTATLGWTSCLLDAQGNATYTINGGVINGEIRDYNKNTTVYGGIFTHNSVKNFLAAGYQAVDNKNGTYTVMPVVAGDTVEATAIPGIYEGDKVKTYYVADKTGLMNLNKLFATTYAGEGVGITVELLADVDLAGEDWKPLEAMWVTFNGNGHTISNLTASGMDAAGRRSGFWSYAGAVTINNLTLENATVNGSQAGIFAGAAEGMKINNCFLKGDNTVNYVDGVEDWNGIGAITGVAVGSNINVTIVDGATVTLNKAGFTTDAGCTYIDNLTGYIQANQGTVVNNGKIVVGVATTAELIDAIKYASVGSVTEIALANGTYAGNIDITVAALGKSGGDVVIKAAEGAKPVITGKVTLGYRNQGVAAAMYDANVTFEGITFDQAAAAAHSITIGDVKSLTLKDCTIIGDGEYGIDSARGNATGTSKIVGCTFESAAMQLLGNLATGLVIDDCTFNNSRINVQAGNGVTVQNCVFNSTLTAAHVGDSFYMIRSNSTPITVKNCEINIDSELTEVASAQAKWYLLANRGTTNWTVENTAVTLTAAAQTQTALVVTACTSTGVINTTNLTVNGVVK